jgi:hypothetical protein
METADIIRAAARLLAKPGETGERVVARALPTSDLQQALAVICDAETVESLQATRPDMKALVRDVLDWSEPTTTRATKPVVKTISSVMTGSNDTHSTTYPQAVEMLSYLALWSPLLDADRLARVATHCQASEHAYAPLRYILGPSGQLGLLLRHYSQERLELLAGSLWDESHDGRWWLHTTGDTSVRKDSGRGRNRVKVSDEERIALNAQLDSVLDDSGTLTPTLLTSAIAGGCLSYSTDLAEALLSAPEPTRQERHDFLEALGRTHDEDHRVLASMLPWLTPAQRPESPVSVMISVLLTVLGGPAEFTVASLPAKPGAFSDLYPDASRIPFNYPKGIMELNGARMPGLRRSDIEILSTPELLKHNSTYMGNCTFSYLNGCLQGRTVMVRFDYQGGSYNASFEAVGDGTYKATQVKARFNARADGDVHAACGKLATLLGARAKIV